MGGGPQHLSTSTDRHEAAMVGSVAPSPHPAERTTQATPMHAVECAAVPRMMSVVAPTHAKQRELWGRRTLQMVERAMPWPARCHAAQIKPDMLLQLRPALPQVLLRAGATGRFVDLCVQDA